ncbi:hypothetical protein HK104_004631, partial [Borealophlyctis nickersoniae]
MEESRTDAIGILTTEERMAYASIDSQHSKEAAEAPVRNGTQSHDLSVSGEMDVDVSEINAAPVDDAVPSHDLPASGRKDADDVSLSTSATPATRHRPLADVDDVDLAKGIKSVIKFKCYTLQNFDMTRLNHTEFHEFREFFSTTRDPRRGSARARNAQTINKTRERICGYLGWLKESGRLKHPSFSDFEDVDTFL